MDAMAPSSIDLPSGRKMRLTYEPGSPPHGRARIQDLFGLRATPKIAAARASVVIEILAPNNRPVQITEDLGRFWNVHYPDIKKSLSRRYPKHEWK
jgi:ATP-dependent helicase HrpB